MSMPAMAVHARWEVDLRIATGKDSTQEAVTEETPLPGAARSVVKTIRRRWFGRTLGSLAAPFGIGLIKWLLRIHGFII